MVFKIQTRKEKKKSKSVPVWFLRWPHLLDSARGMLFICNPGPAGGGQGRDTRAGQESQGPILGAESQHPAGKGHQPTQGGRSRAQGLQGLKPSEQSRAHRCSANHQKPGQRVSLAAPEETDPADTLTVDVEPPEA